jgi:hypothetical protein
MRFECHLSPAVFGSLFFAVTGLLPSLLARICHHHLGCLYKSHNRKLQQEGSQFEGRDTGTSLSTHAAGIPFWLVYERPVRVIVHVSTLEFAGILVGTQPDTRHRKPRWGFLARLRRHLGVSIDFCGCVQSRGSIILSLELELGLSAFFCRAVVYLDLQGSIYLLPTMEGDRVFPGVGLTAYRNRVW